MGGRVHLEVQAAGPSPASTAFIAMGDVALKIAATAGVSVSHSMVSVPRLAWSPGIHRLTAGRRTGRLTRVTSSSEGILCGDFNAKKKSTKKGRS